MAASSSSSSAASATADEQRGMPGMIDVAINLLDPMYQGVYNGKHAHPPDLSSILSRARASHVVAQLITGGSLSESRAALELAAQHDDLYATVGVHPTRAGEFEEHAQGKQGLVRELEEVLEKEEGKVRAIGECGLDYDRLHFAPSALQRSAFSLQLSLQSKYPLPLFLHSRAAHADFVEVLRPHLETLQQAGSPLAAPSEGREEGRSARWGVVHSFTGTMVEAKELLDMGLYIGVNGCSLKTQENLDVVAAIPLERLLIETDAPWCEPRPSHASASILAAYKAAHPVSPFFPAQVKKEKWSAERAVKGRHEPAALGQIAVVVAHLKSVPVEEVARRTTENAKWLFGLI